MDVGLSERNLSEEHRIVIELVAKAAERRGVFAVAEDRGVAHAGATRAADCDRRLTRRDIAKVDRRRNARRAEFEAVYRTADAQTFVRGGAGDLAGSG